MCKLLYWLMINCYTLEIASLDLNCYTVKRPIESKNYDIFEIDKNSSAPINVYSTCCIDSFNLFEIWGADRTSLETCQGYWPPENFIPIVNKLYAGRQGNLSFYADR